jgi:hypothetical protein
MDVWQPTPIADRREGMQPEPKLKQNSGFFQDLLQFLIQNKKWWLVPIVFVILLMGILVVLGSTAAAPFIYTLF